MSKKFLRAISAVLVLVLLFGIAGCGNKETDEQKQDTTQTSEQSDDLILVKTSGQNVVQTAVPLIAGELLKTWENYGITTERIHYVSGPPQLEANPSGDWDIGWIGATAALTGQLKYDMVVIGLSGYDYSNVAFARSDSNIVAAGDQGVAGTFGTADDWRGKDIIVGVGTVNYADLMLTLNELGLTDEDVNIINMDISTGMQAFLAGEGDIWYGSSTYATEVGNRDGFEVIHTMEGMDAGMAGTLIANRTYLAENEETVVKYLEGALDVLLWLADENNNEQTAEWFVQVMSEDFGVEMSIDDALANVKQIGFRDLAFYESLCETGDDGLTGLQREYQKFFEYHVAIGSQEESNLQNILDAVDSSYLEKAIENHKQANS